MKGEIKISGNKNAALPCIAATLLSNETVTLRNIPNIEDVRVMLDILRKIGFKVTRDNPSSTCIVEPADIIHSDIPLELGTKIRASILFAGPLLARTGRVTFPPPGGDVIGKRRLDTHFLALKALGAIQDETTEQKDTYSLHTSGLRGSDIFLDETSVTATENAIMAAVLAKGKTTIENAASEPHVQDLCHLLCKMGADIEGIGSNILTIQGQKNLGKKGLEFEIGPDYMEIGSFIGLAAVSRGELTLCGIDQKHMKMMQLGFQKLGLKWDIEGRKLLVSAKENFQIQTELGNAIPKIDDAPWPGFPPDLISIAIVVATQAEGIVLIHEKMYESRLFFVDKLIEMGAQIILCDPHRVIVAGPSKLIGSKLISPDVRAGMAMLLAAVCAEGESTIHNIYQIERGYENICERLRGVGVSITRGEE